MPRLRKPVLLVHLLVHALLGILLFLLPGRFLTAIGWAPIDPIISRVLGAALLTMSGVHLRLWRGAANSTPAGGVSASAVVRLWAQAQIGFGTLISLGVARHLVFGWWPTMVWILFFLSLFSGVAWLLVLLQERPNGSTSGAWG